MLLKNSCDFSPSPSASPGRGTALLLEGGGMRAGFVAGGLMALMDAGINSFDYGLAVSASVPSLAYFKAGQRRDMEWVWRHELDTAYLVQYKNYPAASLALSEDRPILNIDYLVDEVFQKKYPLSRKQLQENPMQALFAATDLKQRELTLFSADHPDIYSVFKAAMAVPGCYLGTVRVDQQECVDGGLINFLPLDRLLRFPVDRVLVFLTRPLGTGHMLPGFLEKGLFYRFFAKNEWMFAKLQETEQNYTQTVSTLQTHCEQQPDRVMIIAPEKRLPVRFISRNKKRINRTIDIGYEQVREQEDAIRKFLQARSALRHDSGA
ncbi:MAG: hypothetical protein K9K64_11930 [Desulfohalobiaceae bacterium]|nr:hypothetical protein [Desulfohalobiaceae bacterium]